MAICFLPVKAEIRKKIKKKEGDHVRIVLYPDNEPLEIPSELLLCLKDEPKAYKFFQSLSEGEQKYYVNWIVGAKKEDTRVTRLATSITRLLNGQKFHDRTSD
ncbi:MAG TPA: YdeI/OmpD-associated family protein [Chryseosolibacter sp.]|nr:YdeI/OmpD-associated family protein [Chryseosolibacter sp.]